MSDQQALLAAIAAHPDDDTPRLVYADWLDEHEQPARAEFIRVQVERKRLEDHAYDVWFSTRHPAPDEDTPHPLTEDARRQALDKYVELRHQAVMLAKREGKLLDGIGTRVKGTLGEETQRLLNEANGLDGEDKQARLQQALSVELSRSSIIRNDVLLSLIMLSRFLSRSPDEPTGPEDRCNDAYVEIFGRDIAALLAESRDTWKLPEWEKPFDQNDFARGLIDTIKITEVPSPDAVASLFATQPIGCMNIDSNPQDAILSALQAMPEYPGVRRLKVWQLSPETLRALPDRRGSEKLEELHLKHWQELDTWANTLDALAKASPLPSLRVLNLGHGGSVYGGNAQRLAEAAQQFICSPFAQSLEEVRTSQEAARIFALMCERNPGFMPKLKCINHMEVLHQSGRAQVNMGMERVSPEMMGLNLPAFPG